MAAPIFIGDEVSATGYRLAGARVYIPAPEAVAATLRTACGRAPLVLISAEYAQYVPAAELERALAGVSPLVVVVPDARQRVPLPDLGSRLRGQLGVEE